MAKASKKSFYWLCGLIGGVLVGVFFARKKGSVLRKQLVEADDTATQLLLFKDEYVAMLKEIVLVTNDVLHTPEVQQAVKKLLVLTKELLPRRENEED